MDFFIDVSVRSSNSSVNDMSGLIIDFDNVMKAKSIKSLFGC